MQWLNRLNRALDAFVRSHVNVLGRAWPAFQVCGYTGLAVAVALALALVTRRGLAAWPMLAVVIAACATFFTLVFASKIVTGEETIVYYHHEIAVLVVAGLLLALLRQPVPAYLDATLLGVGAFLAFGRVGCLMAGCCHGRPCPLGVRYRHEHADIGLPRYFVGVRLFPIQAVESAWVACVVAAGAAMVWRGAPPGAALAWYVIMYDLGRFMFEWVRGDLGRPYHAGFSEAQWISLILALLVSILEVAGWLPFQTWHVAVAAVLAMTMLAVGVVRKLGSSDAYRILEPVHMDEIGRVMLSSVEARDAPVTEIITTSLGYRMSAGATAGPEGMIRHYTLSTGSGLLDASSARAFARLFRQLQPEAGFEVVWGGRQDIVHLVARRPH